MEEQVKEVVYTFDKLLTRQIQRLSSLVNVTINTIVETAWGVLLQKYNRNTDVVFGKVVSGRNADIQGMARAVGLFINTIPIRVKCEESTTVEELLGQIQQQAVASMEYDFCSLSEVQSRSALGNNLIRTLFVFENYYIDESFNLGSSRLKIEIESAREQTNYDISLSAFIKEVLTLKIMYDPGKYGAEEIRTLLGRMEQLLQQMTANPKQKVSELSVVTEEEKRLVIETFNDTAAEYPREKTVVELFEEQVQKTPDHIAVVFEDAQLTYAQLNEKANQLAYKLRELGIRPDDRVAILAHKSMEMIVGIYGILKAGGAYVPVDPSYPENRIQYMLENCQPKAILLGRAELPIKGDTPVIDLTDKEVYTGKAANPEPVNTPQDLMYIIYTSGTTGKPKGVMIEHEGVVNFREYFIKNYAITAADVVLQFASFSFDASVYEMTMSLLVGAQLCLCPEDVQKDARLFEQYIDKHNVTIAILPPQYLAQVDIRHFRAIITGGSETNRELVGANNKHMKYSNDYGPTEATVCATHWECVPGEPVPERIPIGKPIVNKQIYIMNGNDLCGIGMPGELCIAGVGLARGYLNRPELTAEKFVENHFGEGRMYRSGDLARWLPDGNIEYMGRIDEQVKIRGFRVELGEIESVLRKQPGVNDVAVVAKENNGENSICAYVVSDQELRSGDIKDSLRKELPEYMVPAYIVQIESIPLNRNGKLDKHALPEPEAASGQQYIAPRNEIEEIVAGAFAEILGVTQMGIQDNFFEMGGHSLRATRVINQIEVKTGVRLPLKAIFAAPTAQLLAKEIEQAKAKEYVPIPQAESKEMYPMSSAQKRLYLLNQIDDAGIAYNIPAGVVIHGTLDMDRMKYALEQLTIRHESLRTSFHMQDGEPVQKIAQEVQLELEYEERIAGAEQEENLLHDFVHPFDLGKAPLIRIKAVKIGEDKTVLLLDMHHIISDGMSVDILTNELSRLYNGEQLQPLSVQYKDYSEWMRARDLSEQKKYWLDVFKEPAPVLDLQLDFVRPQTQSFKGHSINGVLTAKQKKAVDELCRKTGATAYMVLLSTMMVLLGKYSRQEDIVIGSPISGRTHKDTEQMVGMFVNTLAMRACPKGDKKALDFLKEIKESALKAYENQEYPFEELVESVEVRRDLSRNPLFDVMFVLQNNEQANLEMNGLQMTSIGSEHTVAKFDLTLSIGEMEDGYAMTWEYCTDLFELESVKRMMKHFSHLVDELTENPERKISELSVIDEEEQRLIIETFNDTAAEYPREKTVVELFEEQVQKTPDHIAVVFADETMSYAMLNEKANQLAYKLRELGVRADDRVAILAQRSMEMIIGIYGIIKAGGAYMPVDPSYPENRIQYMLEDCRPKAILLGRAELPFKGDIPVIDLYDKEVYSGEAANPVHVNTPQDLIYVIYTSGTTGKPKGVMIEHRNVVNFIEGMPERISFEPGRSVLSMTTISFDIFVLETLLPLAKGLEVILTTEDQNSNPDKLAALLDDTSIDVIQLTPSRLQMLLSSPSVNKHLAKVKDILIGGEAMPQPLLDRLKAVTPARIYNMYGPTEATVWALVDRLDNCDSLTIGKPIANTRVYVTDADNRMLGIGMPGELWIAGAGLARGYLNRPELTAEKFVENHFGEGRMYRSGDLARWLPDGNIEYMGRIDEQVKIRGFRVELGEIESVLRKQPAVKDVAVAVKEKNGDKSICAYVVSDQQIRTGDIKDRLRKELPEYMVPAYIVQIESIPLNRNGKLDKHALPEPEAASGQQYIAPRNEIEEIVACTFAEVLSVSLVGIEDNFFELGGHSLRATRVVNQIEVKTGVRLPLKAIFAAPTARLLAIEVEQAKAEKYIPIPRAEEKEVYPMSSAQKRLYLIHQMDDVGTAYNMPAELEFYGTLNMGRMKCALEQLTIRHEALRTSYHMQGGETVQKIAQEVQLELEYEERITVAEQEALLHDFVHPFDLGKAPLMRMKAVKLGEDKTVLLLDMHHIISDGMSVDILTNELSKLYNDEQLQPLSVQYKDYSEWMRTRDLSEQKKYWQGVFKEPAPVLDLQLDFVRPQTQSFKGHSINGMLTAKQKTAVDELCRKTGATAYMVLLSALMVLLGKYSRQEDIVIGSPISGRTHKDTEQMVGMFVNTLAMRGYPKGDKKVLDFLKEIKESALKAYENQEYPFEELVESVEVRRDLSRNPLFDVMFVLHNNEQANLEMNGLQMTSIDSEHTVAKFDLTLSIGETEDGYAMNWEYCTDLFELESVKRMMKHFSHLVDELTANPEQKISELSVVDEEEQRLIIEAFNDTAAEYPREKTVVELFEEQVQKTPYHIAVVFEDETMSYAMLNEKANQLAYKLRELGVRADDRVAILSQRSMEMIIGIFGILKAGGAYVPVDPSYPEKRIQYMLEDCGPKAVLLGRAELPIKGDIPVIDLMDKEVYSGEATNPEHVNTPQDLMYIIYTSGTTGQPKGVMIEQRNVVRLLFNDRSLFDFGQEDVWTLFHSFCFDFSVWEMYGALLFGGKLVIVPSWTARNPVEFLQLIERERVTILNQTPTAFYHLVKEALRQEKRNLRVRKVIFGGEALVPVKLQAFRALHPEVQLINMYGITETTVHVTYKELTAMDLEGSRSNIGKPIPTLQAYVLNAQGKIAPVGVPGELYVGGAGVARGYLNRPELTAEKFISNPYEPGERMYRTGDFARWLPDGNIEYLGRIDQQVKIRGFRVELGEIENVLQEIDCIRDAAVIARTDASGDKVIYAYLTSDETLDIRDIRSKLMNQLPQYMVPAYMGQVDAIPVTTNGKVDKRRLSMVEIVKNPGTKEYMEPKNDKEAVICKVYRDILNHDKVSTNDTFFELGGDSIKAIRIVSKLKEYGYNARVREILNNTSISELAEFIEEIDGSVREQNVLNGGVENKQTFEEIVNMDIASVRYEDQLDLPVVLQEEVKVYLHRSLPLCIILAYDNYKGWYYSNYIQIFSQDDEHGHTELNYIEPRDSYMDVSEVICLGYHMFRENEDFVDFIKNKLRLGYYLIANVDEMELKNKNAYQRDHFIHASLIYGYDDNKRTLQGIGFDDSGIFSYLEFDYDEMQRAFTSGKKYYKTSAPWCEWSAVQLVRPKTPDKKFVFNNRKFLTDLHDYVHSVEDSYRLYTFGYSEDKTELGISTYDVVIERLKEKEKTGRSTIDYRAIHLIHEHKQGLYNRIRYLDDIYGLSEEVKNENQKLHELVEDINKVRIKWLSIEYNAGSDIAKVNAVTRELISDITNLKIKEIPIITKLYELLEKQLGNKKVKVNPDHFIKMG